MNLADVLRRLRRPYRDDMSIIRRPGGQPPSNSRPDNLQDYANEWVAVLHGDVVARGATSRELAVRLRELGPDFDAAVMQFVRPPMASYVIGVG